MAQARNRRMPWITRCRHHIACVGMVMMWVMVALVVVAETPHANAASLPAPTSPVVHIVGAAYPPGVNPNIVTVHIGDTITFENNTSPTAVHSLVAEDGSFTTPPLAPGQQWSTSFDQPGSHIYHDPTAYTQVVGVIIVVPSSVALQAPDQPGKAATVVAQANAMRAGGQSASVAPSGLVPWLLVPVALGLGGLAYLLYRMRRGTTTIK